jgi:hypothetical protein
MGKYRQKQAVVEAMQFTDETKDQVFNWVTCNRYPDWVMDDPVIIIQTLDGNMIAHFGDWIIKTDLGNFHVCKSEVFDKVYEQVEVDKEIINTLGYAIQSYMSGSSISDKKLAKMWDECAELLNKIEDYLEDYFTE